MDKRENWIKGVLNEFKTFALKGSVVDLSVGIIIGAAFNNIVNSLVKDIVMPPLGLLLGRVDFAELYLNLGQDQYESLSAAQAAGAPTINYGIFINSLIGFLVTALAVFFLIKLINKLRKQEEKSPKPTPTTTPCPYCFNQVSLKATRCPFCTSALKGN